jgi:hypothetical protein
MASLPDPHDDEHKPKREPYAQVPHYVLAHPDLSRGDRELYAHLDSFWRGGTVCSPPQATLAARMGVRNVCTVHRRARKLEQAGLLKVVRQGLKKPNKYVKLPPPRGGLRVVRDLAEVQGLDLAEMQGKNYDEDLADKGKNNSKSVDPMTSPSRVIGSKDRLHVVRYMEHRLLPILRDLHRSKRVPFSRTTSTTFARLILSTPGLHEGHIAHVCDRFTGHVPDGRFSVFDVDEIENPAAYAYAALESYFADYMPATLPTTYAQP